MYSSFRDEPEPEPEPEPENWSANLIIAAKGGAVELEEERDEWGAVVQDAERLTGLALAKRCRAEGADLAYTGAELGSGEEDGEEADGGALTALGWASSFKNIPVMEYLQLEDATERLIDACREGDLARATQARMDGADLLAVGELETGQENWCPLLELAQRWNNYDVEAFLEQEFKGAALELIIAAKEADSKRAFLARRADADLEHIDWEYGYTPLLWAARKGSAELIRFLLEEGADANASCAQGGNRGTTALMEATVWSTNSHPHIAAMKALLGDDGHPSTDINAKRGDGATALCLAAWVGNEPACRVLLEHKADPSIKYMGKTALQLARKGKHEALTAMLRDAGEAWRLKGLFRAASPSF